MPTDVFAHQLESPVGARPAGRVHRSAGRVQGLIGGEASSADWITPTGRGAPPVTGWICLRTASTPSAPQMPHPVRPVSRRVRPAITSAQRGATVAWISTPRL